MLNKKNVGIKKVKGKTITVLSILALCIMLMSGCSYAVDIDVYNSGTVYRNDSEVRLYLGLSKTADKMFYNLKVYKNAKLVHDKGAYNIAGKNIYYTTDGEGMYTTKMRTSWTGDEYNGKTVYVDRTPPEASVTHGDKGDTYLVTVEASDNSSGISKIIIDEETYSSGKASKYIKKTTSKRTIKIYVYDGAGNAVTANLEIPAKTSNSEDTNKESAKVVISSGSSSSGSSSSGGTVNVDRTKPTISSLEVVNSGTYTNKNAQLKAVASDSGDGIVAYTWSQNANLTYNATNWEVYSDGKGRSSIEKTYEVSKNGTWYFYAIDKNGNQSSKSVVVSNIDKEGPTITISETTSTIATSQTVKATIQDSKSGVSAYMFTQQGGIKADSTGWTILDSTTEKTSVELKAAANGKWYLYAKDALGNMSTKTVTITNIDTTAPEINSILLNTTSETIAPLRLLVTASDKEDNLAEIQIVKSATPDDSKWTTIKQSKGSNIIYLSVTENGLYYVHVKDTAGNKTSKSVEVKNIVNELPEDNTKTESVDTLNNKYINEDFIPTTAKTTIKRVVLINKTTGLTEGYWLGDSNNAGKIDNYNRDNDPDPYPYSQGSTETGNLITAADARIALRVANGFSHDEIQAIAGDADGNGITESSDAETILRISTELEKFTLMKNRSKLLPAITTEGEYELVLTEFDGETRKDAVSYSFTLDKTAPSVNISVSGDNSNEDGVTFIGTASDSLSNIVAYQFSTSTADDTKWVTIQNSTKETTQTYTVTEAIDDLYFYVKDEAGNVGNINVLNLTGNVNESADIMSPTITTFKVDSYQLKDENSEDTSNGDLKTQKLVATATDNVGIVAYQFSEDGKLNASSSGWTTVSSTIELSKDIKIDAGKTEYYFYVKDTAGNYSVKSLSGKNDRDTQKPSIINVYGSGEENVNTETIEIEATDFKGGSGIVAISVSSEKEKYNWTNAEEKEDATNENKIYTAKVTANGNYYIYVKDKEGNISNAYRYQVANIVPKVSSSDISLAYDDTLRIYGTVETALTNSGSGEIKSVQYSSSNTSVAKVDTDGNLSGISKGTATLTATVTNYDDTTAIATCNVEVLDEEINIVEEPVSTEVVGATEIKLKVETEEGTNIQYQWYETNSENNTNGTAISGATTNTYTVTGDDINSGTYYYATLSNNSNSLSTKTTLKTSAVHAASYKEPKTPTISVVDNNNKIISSGEWATSNLVITVDGDTSGVGAGEIKYKYSYDNKTWTDYARAISYKTETKETTIYVKAYNTENEDLESEVVSFVIKLDKTAPTIKNIVGVSYDFETGYPKEVVVTNQSVNAIKYAKAYEVTVDFDDNIKTTSIEYKWVNTDDSVYEDEINWKKINVDEKEVSIKIDDVDDQKSGSFSGKYMLLVRGIDEAGNISETARQPYYFDNDIDIVGKASLMSNGKSIVQNENEDNTSYMANSANSDIEISLNSEGNDYNSGINRTSYYIYKIVDSSVEFKQENITPEIQQIAREYRIMKLAKVELINTLDSGYIDIQAVALDQTEPVNITKDGIYAILVKTVDELGNYEYRSYWVGRDTNTSTETKTIVTLEEQVDDYKNITGVSISAKDSSGIKNVYYKWVLNNDDDATKDAELKSSNKEKIAANDYEGLNNDAWKELKADENGNYLAPTKDAGCEGECYLVVKVTDGLGNNDYYAELFTIDGKVTNPSTLSINLLDEDENYIKDENNNNKTVTPEANVTLTINNKAEIDIQSGSDGKNKNAIHTTYTITKDGNTSDEYLDAISKHLTDDGLYTIKVKSEDSLGNSTTITYKVLVDTTAPTIELSTNDSVIGSSSQVTVKLNDADGTGIDFRKTRYMWTRGYRPSDDEINNPDSAFSGNITSASTTLTSPNTGDSGVWCLWILTYDKAGNMTRNEYKNIITDVSAPIAGTITAKTVSDNKDYIFTVSEDASNEYTGVPVYSDVSFTMKNGYDLESNVSTTTINCTRKYNGRTMAYDIYSTNAGVYTLTETGVYTIIVTTTNKANSALKSSNIYIIQIDKEAPTVIFNSNENKTYAKQHSTTVSITDTISGINTSKTKYYWEIDGEKTKETSISETEFEVKTPEGATGSAILYVYTEDNCGNGEYKNSGIFNIDNDAPTKAIITATTSQIVGTQLTDIPYYSEITNKEVTLTASESMSLSGVDRYEFTCTTDGGATWSEWAKCTRVEKNGEVFWQLKAVEEGTYVIKVRGISELTDGENIGIESEEFIVRIDKTAPTVEYANIDDGLNGSGNWAQAKGVKITIQDPAGINTNVLKYAWVRANETANNETALNPLANGEPIVTPANAEGEYKLYVYSEDSIGNGAGVYSNVYKIDTKVPETPIITPNVTGTTVNTDVALAISGSSATSGITYKYSTDNGSTWNDVTNNNILLNKEGENKVIVKAISGSGIESANSTYTVIIDKTAPSIQISPNGGTYDKLANVVINVYDELTGLSNQNQYEYYLSTSKTEQENGSWISFVNGEQFTIGEGLQTGIYYLHIREVSDNAGNNTGSIVSAAFTIRNTVEEEPEEGELYIKSDVYTVDRSKMYIMKIAPNTKLEEFLKNITTSGLEDEKIIITDIKNKTITDNSTIVCTGTNIEVKTENSSIKYVLIVRGDVNGDGKANINDIFTINKYRLNKITLDKKYIIAGDVNDDGVTGRDDILKLNKYRLNKIDNL